MKAIRTVGGWLTNYPLIVTGLICALVVAHFYAAQVWPWLNVPAALADTTAGDPQDTLMSLSIGVAGVSAMVGGFAGVVVVFGLGTENDRFRLLRRNGSRRLRANWVSVVLSSFTGAFGALISAVIVVAFGAQPGMWVLEACLFITAHAAIRLTALLAGLAGIVDSTDDDAERTKKTVKTKDVLPSPAPE